MTFTRAGVIGSGPSAAGSAKPKAVRVTKSLQVRGGPGQWWREQCPTRTTRCANGARDSRYCHVTLTRCCN